MTGFVRRWVALFAVLGALGALINLCPAADDAAVAASAKDGWRELSNGKDLAGWQNASGGKPGAGWVVEDGAMVRQKQAGDVWTKDRFGDFVLDLEFKTEGNSGVFIRTGDPKDCVQTEIEMQVLPPVPPDRRPSKNSCGSVYDALAPTKEVTKKGQWNHVAITAVGSKITIEMNGQQIIDADLDRWDTPGKNPDGSKNKYRKALKDFPREGHVGLQDHGAKVAYRNIKIKPVEAK